MTITSKLEEELKAELALIEERGLTRKIKNLRFLDPVRAIDEAGKEYLVFSSNNYLGLTHAPAVIEAAKEANNYGTGSGGARLTTGGHFEASILEKKLADFKHTEKALIFNTGYMTNLGVLYGLVKHKDVVFSDELNHASIIDGAKISKATVKVYKHADAADLERLLREDATEGNRFIITDGVFSMDGDIAPLPQIVTLSKQYGARVLVDEAHATGVLGPGGRGTVEHFGLQEQVDVVIGTFSKTLAATGGFAATSRHVAQYIRQYGRAYTFSASPAPSTIAAVRAGLQLIQREPTLREKLWDNVHYIHKGLHALGFSTNPASPESAILTIVIGPDWKVHQMSRDLYEAGLFTSTVVYPAVPPNRGTLRLSLSALHTREDLDTVLSVLGTIGKKYELIP